MIINVTPEWRLKTDKFQWQVQRRRSVNGVHRWLVLAYCQTVQFAARRVAVLMVEDSGTIIGLRDAAALETLAAVVAEIIGVFDAVYQSAGILPCPFTKETN